MNRPNRGVDPQDTEECPECGWLYGGHEISCEIYANNAQDYADEEWERDR